MVEALERGLNKSEAARLFGVSLSSVKRYAKLAREGLLRALRVPYTELITVAAVVVVRQGSSMSAGWM